MYRYSGPAVRQHGHSTDRSLCDGAPVYQRGGTDRAGPVMYRFDDSGGGTVWEVIVISVLETCGGYYYM